MSKKSFNPPKIVFKHRPVLTMQILIAVVLLVSILLAQQAEAKDYALVVGVGSFSSPGIPALKGVENDVASVAKAMDEVFKIESSNITVLHDRKATRRNILSTLDGYASKLRKGDRLYFYFSGHGTSAKDRKNSNLTRLIPYQSGAILPYDVNQSSGDKGLLESLIIGRRDLKHRLAELDSKGVEAFVFFDSCYSGNAVRSISLSSNAVTTREHTFVFDEADDDEDEDQDSSCFACGSVDYSEYPYKNVYFMSAAAETEEAIDIDQNSIDRYPTLDNKYHGAFTDALLRIWSGNVKADANADGNLSMQEINTGVSCFMERRGYGHEPQLLPTALESSTQMRQIILGSSQGAGTTKSEFSVKLQGVPEAWRNNINQLPRVSIVNSNAELSVRLDGSVTTLTNRAGERIGNMQVNSADDLEKRIQMAQWIKNLKGEHCLASGTRAVLQIGSRGQGSNFKMGQSVPISFKSGDSAYWLILDINSAGELYVLYPNKDKERKKVAADTITSILDGDGPIIAGEPVGIDTVVALAFSKKPYFFDDLANVRASIAYGDKNQQQLEHYINQNIAKVGVAVVDLRVHKK